MSITKDTKAGVCKLVHQVADNTVTVAGIVIKAVLSPCHTLLHLGQLSVTHNSPSEVMSGQRRKDAHCQ